VSLPRLAVVELLFGGPRLTLCGMSKPFPSITTDQIDSNSEKLLKEWRQHFENFVRDRPDLADAPGKIDRTLVFESWISQKVSYLQLQVVELVGEVENLLRIPHP
jgi:hypothetical protein